MAEQAAGMPDVLSLETFLPYRLNILAERVSLSFSKIYAQQFGISVPEWRVMAIIGQYGTVTSREIGRRSHMHKTKVSRAVTALERRTLIHRQNNPGDQREVFLQLTRNGRATYEELVPQALAFSNELMNSLDAAQRQALDGICNQLLEAADKFNPDAPGSG
ncbi:MarR family transcriptional regulator [Roseibium sp. RKSG952]|nr:MarR family transcriptional regulator [Roseibium sp. RKSG952]